MRIGDFEVTDLTTYEELVGQLEVQQYEIERLETRIEDQNQEISDLSLAPEQMNRLAEAADVMADLGRIHNTPSAKANWASGQ
jgi:hypothetical protein